MLISSFLPRRAVVAASLGLLAAAGFSACSTRPAEGETAVAGTAATGDAAAKPAPVDTIKLKAMAMERDSLKADSIAKKNGQ